MSLPHDQMAHRLLHLLSLPSHLNLTLTNIRYPLLQPRLTETSLALHMTLGHLRPTAVRTGRHNLLALLLPQSRDVPNRGKLCPRRQYRVRPCLPRNLGRLLGPAAESTNAGMNDPFRL